MHTSGPLHLLVDSDIQAFLEKNPGLALNSNDIVNRHLVAQINKLALYLTTRECSDAIYPASQ
jgi:hypothetical protein